MVYYTNTKTGEKVQIVGVTTGNWVDEKGNSIRISCKKRKSSSWNKLVKDTYRDLKKNDPNVTLAEASRIASQTRADLLD